MRAAIQAVSGKAEEEPILVCTGDDGNAAGRRLGAGPRRQRSAGHALTLACAGRSGGCLAWDGTGHGTLRPGGLNHQLSTSR
jgi:hypothetical protein